MKLSLRGNNAFIVVENDGRGIDYTVVSVSYGIGLAAIHERDSWRACESHSATSCPTTSLNHGWAGAKRASKTSLSGRETAIDPGLIGHEVCSWRSRLFRDSPVPARQSDSGVHGRKNHSRRSHVEDDRSEWQAHLSIGYGPLHRWKCRWEWNAIHQPFLWA